MRRRQKNGAEIIAFAASSVEDKTLYIAILHTVEDILRAIKEENHVQRKDREDFLQFLFVTYMTKHTFEDPFDMIESAEKVERVIKLIHPETN